MTMKSSKNKPAKKEHTSQKYPDCKTIKKLNTLIWDSNDGENYF